MLSLSSGVIIDDEEILQVSQKEAELKCRFVL
jgi:hypothetical protein